MKTNKAIHFLGKGLFLSIATLLIANCSKTPGHLIHPNQPTGVPQGVDLSVLSLGFTGDDNLYIGNCSKMAVIVQDGLGNIVLAPSKISFDLSQDGSAKFFSDSACTSEITEETIDQGYSSQSVYVRATGAAGNIMHLTVADQSTKTLTASRDIKLLAPSSLSISDYPSYDFGFLPLGMSASKTFELSNGALTEARNISFSSLSSPFSIASTTCTGNLKSQERCFLTVNFSPTALGNFSVTLNVSYSDGVNLQSLTEGINGTGVGMPTKLVFSGSQNFFTGTCAALSLISGDSSGNPTGILATTLVSLAASGTAQFFSDSFCAQPVSSVSFAPGVSSLNLYVKDVVAEQANLSAADASNNPTGTLASAAFQIHVATTAGLTISDGPSYDFGSVPQNQLKTMTFTISNSGLSNATNLNFSSLAAPFSMSSKTCGSSLAAGAACSVTIAFQSSNTGAANSILQLIYYDGESYQVASNTIHGTVVGNATHIGFTGNATPIAGGCYPYVIGALDSNNNLVPALNDINLSLSGNGSGTFYSDSGCSQGISSTLIHQGDLSVKIYFSDTTSENINLNANSNGSLGAGQASVNVLKPANLVFQGGTSYDFKGSLIGSVVTHAFSIQNTGDVSATSISQGNIASPFSYAGGTFPGTGGSCTSTLAGGATCTLVFQFAPGSPDPFSSLVLIPYQNGLTLKISEMSLSGIGVIPTKPFQKANSFNGNVNELKMAEDGIHVYVGGSFTTYGSNSTPFLTRLGPDMKVDSSFNPGVGPNAAVYVILPINDGTGKLYVAGTFTKYNNVAVSGGIVRIFDTGALDTSFAAPTINRLPVQALAIVNRSPSIHQLYVGGIFTAVGGNALNALVRLNQDGSLDSGFSTGTGFTLAPYSSNPATVYSLLVGPGPNPWILVGGNFQTYNTTTIGALIRLTDSGAPDVAYNANIGTGAIANIATFPYVNVLTDDGQGNVYVTGNWLNANARWPSFHFRLTSTGTVDTSFNQVSGFSGTLSPMVMIPGGNGNTISGNVVSYGGVSQPQITILTPTGALVQTNLLEYAPTNGTIFAIAAASDGSFYVGGNFTAFNGQAYNRILRFQANGILDPATLQGSGVAGTSISGNVYSIKALNDGSNRIYLAGDFNSFNGNTSYYRLVRMNPDTTVDTSFSIASFNSSVTSLSLDNAGTLYVTGAFTSVSSSPANRIVALTPDGSIKSTFYSGSGFNTNPSVVYAMPNGSAIYVGGAFTSYQATNVKNFVRLLPNGDIDPAFDMGSGFDSYVTGIANANDGSGDIYVVGAFTTYKNVSVPHIARLKSDGSLNNTFNVLLGLSGSSLNNLAVSVNADGSKVYVAGNFTKYQNITSTFLVRINANGSYDNTFNVGSTLNNYPDAIAILPDNSVYIGGYFTTVQGLPSSNIAHLTSSGTYDSSFAVGLGLNNVVYSLLLAPDGSGSVYAGGAFSSYGGQTTDHVVRLKSNGALD